MNIKCNVERDFLDELTDEILKIESMCPNCIKQVLLKTFGTAVECGEALLVDELDDEFGIEVQFDEDGEVDQVIIYDDEDSENCDCGCYYKE